MSIYDKAILIVADKLMEFDRDERQGEGPLTQPEYAVLAYNILRELILNDISVQPLNTG